MLTIIINPPKEFAAKPLKAPPLVHPLANWAPPPKRKPPNKANQSLVLGLILGECCTLIFNRLFMAPEKKAPDRKSVV